MASTSSTVRSVCNISDMSLVNLGALWSLDINDLDIPDYYCISELTVKYDELSECFDFRVPYLLLLFYSTGIIGIV